WLVRASARCCKLRANRPRGSHFGFDRVYITDPHDGASCFVEPRLFDRSIVVIGGEANGARPYEAAHRVRIPMPGDYESLNAAQAATVFLFEFVRRQEGGK
ncbi:MAG: TrmH family RNA methyltransferase, partial [Victivallaceae bacterium]|nr:TrmH family RNA methyltransferase [Victivallaceae bacterium]